MATGFSSGADASELAVLTASAASIEPLRAPKPGFFAYVAVVAEREGADVAAAFGNDPDDGRFVVMQIFFSTSPDPVFSTIERKVGFSNGPKECVEDF